MHIPDFDNDIQRIQELSASITKDLTELHHLLENKTDIASKVVDHENSFQLDMNHLLESRKMNAAEGTKMSKYLADSRIRRRAAKNFLEYSRKISDLVAQSTALFSTMNYRLNEQQQYEKAKVYTFRTPYAWDILSKLQDRSHKHTIKMVQPPKDSYDYWNFGEPPVVTEEIVSKEKKTQATKEVAVTTTTSEPLKKESAGEVFDPFDYNNLPPLYRFTYDEGSFVLVNANDNFSEWSVLRFREGYATYSNKMNLRGVIREIGLFTPDHILYARDNQLPIIKSHVDTVLHSKKQDYIDCYRFVVKELPKARNVTQHSTNQLFAYAKKHFKHLVV